MDVKPSGPFRQRRKRGLEFLTGELIGLPVRVFKSVRKGIRGLEGIVADETKNTLVLASAAKKRIVPKAGSVFIFGGHEGVEVDGEWLVCRPEDRTKKANDLLRRGRMR